MRSSSSCKIIPIARGAYLGSFLSRYCKNSSACQWTFLRTWNSSMSVMTVPIVTNANAKLFLRIFKCSKTFFALSMCNANAGIFSPVDIYAQRLYKCSGHFLTMLSESFVLLPAVRLTKERAIWNQGISSWQDFLSREKIKGLGTARKERCDNLLRIADRNLRQKNGLYFSNALRFCDQWRLYETFKDEAVYLYIETDGYYGGITVVGLLDGVQTKTL